VDVLAAMAIDLLLRAAVTRRNASLRNRPRDRTRDPGRLSLSTPPVNFYFIRSNSTRSIPSMRPTRPISRAKRMRAGGWFRIATTMAGSPLWKGPTGRLPRLSSFAACFWRN